jgi:hypothetical protein
VTSKELLPKLADAIKRQEAMIGQPKDAAEMSARRRMRLISTLNIELYMSKMVTCDSLKSLLAELKNDTVSMPADICDELDLPVGSTYAEGVKAAQALLTSADSKQVEPKAPPATPAEKEVQR